MSATGGGSGNPVVFSVDSSSGAGVCSVSGTDGSTVHFTGVGSCVIDANQAGNAEYLSAATVTVTVTVIDADLALTTPKNIIIAATGANGGTVSYTQPTATDEGATPTVTCTPPSGSPFPIGTTTVTCKASSSDDTNSPVTTSFTVTVQGVLAQLDHLQAYVDGLAPGTALADQVQAAIDYYQSGDIADACTQLGAVVHLAQAQSGKHLSRVQANYIISAAERIEDVLGC